MRPNEQYVLEVLVSEFGGCFIDGDDPPDAYIEIEKKKIAVEVTRLVEHVFNEDGVTEPRLSHDMPAINLANELDEVMKDEIPDDVSVFLVIPSPLKKIRATKRELAKVILQKTRAKICKEDVEVEGNLISISMLPPRPSGKKIVAAISNKYSSANIASNSELILEERITTKSKKCIHTKEIDEYWLALFNDYWLADKDSYQAAYNSINIEHVFDKIFIVNGYGELNRIC